MTLVCTAVGAFSVCADQSWTNGLDADGVEIKWKTLPQEDLRQAAAAGDARAQYACFALGARAFTTEPDNLRQLWVSNYMKMSPAQRDELENNRPERMRLWGQKSAKEVTQAVAAGNMDAMDFLRMERGAKQKDLLAESHGWLVKSAEQGFPPAETAMAQSDLLLGGFVFGDEEQERGLRFLRDAADRGWPLAESLLGNIYLAGELVPRDVALAVHYYRAAADQGAPRAQYNLAELYASGDGDPRDEADSVLALLRKSAGSGHALAMQALGDHYRIGLGAPKDFVQASRCYFQAQSLNANQGYTKADLGLEFANMLDAKFEPQPGISRDFLPFVRVFGLYTKAVATKDGEAMRRIGAIYIQGTHAPKDMVEAYRWFDAAVRHGSATAAVRRDEIKASLTPEQIGRATIPLHELKAGPDSE